jgi:plastocyanin
MSSIWSRTTRRRWWIAASVVALAVGVVAGFAGSVPRASAGAGAGSGAAHDHHAMTEASMRDAVDRWLAAHPEKRGDEPAVAGGPIVTAVNFRFEADGNSGTQIDTVRIGVGETVFWHMTQGPLHTVTNGLGFDDPDAGSMFNAVLQASTPDFSFTFTTAGVVPYFCGPHEFSEMKGVVVVEDVVGVAPAPADPGLGFTARPAPNPTRSGVSFRFTLRDGGPTSVRVYDVRGRAIATIVERSLEAGTYAARWDGRSADGTSAGAGVYFVRLKAPGVNQSQRISVTH